MCLTGMKQFIYIVLLVPIFMIGQNDFETRYFTINATSLPEAPEMIQILKEENPIKGSYTLGASPSYEKARSSFSINATNYWQPVDMAAALKSTYSDFTDPSVITQKVQEKQFGVTISGNGGNTSFDFGDGKTRVRNSVYQEQRPFILAEPGDRFYRNSSYLYQGRSRIIQY